MPGHAACLLPLPCLPARPSCCQSGKGCRLSGCTEVGLPVTASRVACPFPSPACLLASSSSLPAACLLPACPSQPVSSSKARHVLLPLPPAQRRAAKQAPAPPARLPSLPPALPASWAFPKCSCSACQPSFLFPSSSSSSKERARLPVSARCRVAHAAALLTLSQPSKRSLPRCCLEGRQRNACPPLLEVSCCQLPEGNDMRCHVCQSAPACPAFKAALPGLAQM